MLKEDRAHGVNDVLCRKLEAPDGSHTDLTPQVLSHLLQCMQQCLSVRLIQRGAAYGVSFAWPVGQRVPGACTTGSCLHASSSCGPAALCMAPSTPPPPSKGGAAALTMASPGNLVRSPCCTHSKMSSVAEHAYTVTRSFLALGPLSRPECGHVGPAIISTPARQVVSWT